MSDFFFFRPRKTRSICDSSRLRMLPFLPENSDLNPAPFQERFQSYHQVLSVSSFPFTNSLNLLRATRLLNFARLSLSLQAPHPPTARFGSRLCLLPNLSVGSSACPLPSTPLIYDKHFFFATPFLLFFLFFLFLFHLLSSKFNNDNRFQFLKFFIFFENPPSFFINF